MKKKYKKGLIIGKFMPPHEGHLRLIKFASKRARKLVIAVYWRPGEPISGSMRYKWMKEIFSGNKNVEIVQISKKLPQTAKPTKEASEAWAGYISKRFKDIDAVFSSENYGSYLAGYMNIAHEEYDPERKRIPVSAGMIRENPIKYWNYIPREVRPYFVKNNMQVNNKITKKKMQYNLHP